MLEALRAAGFDVLTRNHAASILEGDFGDDLSGLVAAVLAFRMTPREVIQSGGGHSEPTMRLRDALVAAGWPKHTFVVRTIVDGREREAQSHEVDHVRRSANGTLALEIEWNNKDPFFDRDLENFQRLHAQGAISLGVLITRGSSLQAGMVDVVASAIRRAGIEDVVELDQWGVKERTKRQMKNLNALLDQRLSFPDAFARSFVADKFGKATTHWEKLAARVARGVGNPCPLLLLGLPLSVIGDATSG